MTVSSRVFSMTVIRGLSGQQSCLLGPFHSSYRWKDGVPAEEWVLVGGETVG